MRAPDAEQDPVLRELEADATYARWRYELYRDKPYGPRLNKSRSLRKLKEASGRAESALGRAKAGRSG